MENMEINYSFWKSRSVFITGHTGFKGAWLAFWLSKMGAKVHGYSLKPPTNPNLFNIFNLKNKLKSSTIGDIQNQKKLIISLKSAKPSVVFHLAAQSLVRESYKNPIYTFKTNVMGTINLFEAIKKIKTIKAVINITSDKCYENLEYHQSYKETDKLGGHDPYSCSKACAELITSSYRNSFFKKFKIQLASVRAGNVIGGGDWATDRLIPDFFRSLENNKILHVRSPEAIRPWQHVLDPLSGYIKLAEMLVSSKNKFDQAWNFGPKQSGAKSVSWVLNKFSNKFDGTKWKIEKTKKYHEANLLKLDISKAKLKLGWVPRWSLEMAVHHTIEWHKAYKEKKNMEKFSADQITLFENS